MPDDIMNDLMDPRDKLESMVGFAQPVGGELAVVTPAPNAGMTISDGIITAQKVEVERDDAKVLRKIATLAAVAGEDWFYTFPVKKRGGGTESIEGPSIKCANNVARAYGNCQVDTRVQDAGSSWIIYARFVDYETGFSMMRPFQQDKGAGAIGGTNDARRRDMAFQMGVSKAIRNVVCNALETFTTFAFEEAKKNLVGRIGKDLPKYRERVLERIKEMGVDLKRVELTAGRTVDAWIATDVARIVAQIKAIGDGMATIEETWPPLPPAAPKSGDFKKEPDQPAAAEAKKEPPKEEAEGWPLYDETGDTVGRFDFSEWANRLAHMASGKIRADERIKLLENNQETASLICGDGNTTNVIVKALEAIYAPPQQKVEEPAAATETKAAKTWSLPDNIVGQEKKLLAIYQMLDGKREGGPNVETSAEVDALWEAHEAFFEKLGQVKKAAANQRFGDRKIELAQAKQAGK
jgi:hypothetical protein